MSQLAVVIPACNEADRIADTVAAASTLPGVDLVIVVDDGSRDGTARIAQQAGAAVLRHARNRGKAAAMETGARGCPPGRPARWPDPAPAVPGRRPRGDGRRRGATRDAGAGWRGGHDDRRLRHAGQARRAWPCRAAVGQRALVACSAGRPAQPLNGQRCLTRAAFDAARPLARGFGVETALTIDLARKGYRVVDVEVDLAHRATGTDLQSQVHRARQLADVALALLPAWLETSLPRG